MTLAEKLTEEDWLHTPRLIKAFEHIDRKDFVPDDLKDLASADEALSIGWGQTISQPAVVAFMLEKLQPKEGDKILDIGAGSGWTSALLAHIVSQEGNHKTQTTNHKQGKVVAIEVIPELAEWGKRNVAKYNFIEKGTVQYLCQNGSEGYLKEAPYEGILVSASLSKKELPKPWTNQLKEGGKLVVPIQSSVWVFTKKGSDLEEREYPGFVFVPFV